MSYDRQFLETPAFPSIGRVSLSFAWEVRFAQPQGSILTNAGFHLSRLEERIDISSLELISPLRSFLDDVTNGPPGRHGRPLLAAATADRPAYRVTALRPRSWTYDYEGATTSLVVGTSDHDVAFCVKDGFAAFPSGRIYYVLTLFIDPDSGQAIDEYMIIQCQQLAIQPAYLNDSSFLAFQPAETKAAQQQSLLEFTQARLSIRNEAVDERPNALASIIRPLLGGNRKLNPLSARDLCSLCVAIDDPWLMETAHRTMTLTEACQAEGPSGPTQPNADPFPPPHREADNPLDPALLAFSGMAQAVPDYPFQDFSELYDSTRATAYSPNAALYVHPRFFLEVGTSWRSLHMGQEIIGTCPYLLLQWLTAIDAELTVTAMEDLIESIRYESKGSETGHVPLSRINELIRRSRSFFSLGRAHLLERALRRQVQLLGFRDIRKLENMFRYSKEREALRAAQNAMGSRARHDEAEACLDELQSIFEEISALHYSHAERRTNSLLLVIAVLSVMSVSSDIDGELNGAVLGIGFGGIAILLSLFLVTVLLIDQLRMPRG